MEITDIALTQNKLLFDENGSIKISALTQIWYNCVTMKTAMEKNLKHKMSNTEFNTFLEFTRQQKNFQQIRHARAHLQTLLYSSAILRIKKLWNSPEGLKYVKKPPVSESSFSSHILRNVGNVGDKEQFLS